MGSRTYHDMAAFRPYSDSPLAPAMNDIPKVIFSRSGIEGGNVVDRTRELADAKKDRIGHRISATPFGTGVVAAVYQPA